jgi:hypothetical protein
MVWARLGPRGRGNGAAPRKVPPALFRLRRVSNKSLVLFVISAYCAAAPRSAGENRRAKHQRYPGDKEHRDGPQRAS